MASKALAESSDSDYYPALMAQRRSDLHNSLSSICPVGVPLVWELGCGHGHFLTAYSAAHPESHCVGIDLIRERVERATRKRDRAKLPRLHFLQAEARLFLECLPASTTISTVFILFPDPWPKTRHHKNRIIQADFLSGLGKKMSAGGRIYFRTDFRPYFESAAATISSHASWKIIEAPWAFEYETVFQHRADSYHSLVAELRP